jgi:putative nucleotidyltransferase with HDIG domain
MSSRQRPYGAHGADSACTLSLVTGQDAAVVARARALAADIFREDARLQEHAARTARHASALAQRIPSSNRADVTAAAWLHDIGYAPRVRRTGFHPLDGALFLIKEQWPERVVRLVAHHSLASLEAPFYGVGHHLNVIEPVPGIDTDILTAADLAGGSGEPVPTVHERIERMRLTDAEADLIPPDVREERYAGLISTFQRVQSLI